MKPSTIVTLNCDWPTEAPDGCTGRYVALITKVHTDPVPWANAHLCHSTPEMATEWDLVLAPGVVTPYPLVVMGEGYVQVFERQVHQFLADMPVHFTDAVRRAIYSDGQSVAAVNERHPLPFAGPLDPRRRWVEDYILVLRDLSTPVRRLLLDGVADDFGREARDG